MTLMDAGQVDEARERRRRNLIRGIAVLVILLGWLAYHLRNYPERRAGDRFFSALQKQDYESAFGIWLNDPQWKQHPQKYATYPYSDFYRDWGPGGEWGLVKQHDVNCSYATDSGVIVQVIVNQRTQPAHLYVLKSDKTLSFSPTEIQCGNMAWLIE
jgi:hypothetical protein